MGKFLGNLENYKIGKWMASSVFQLVLGFSTSAVAQDELVKEACTLIELRDWAREATLQGEIVAFYFSHALSQDCQFMAPRIHELAQDLQGRVRFFKIAQETARLKPLMISLGIVAGPNLVICKDGVNVATLVGVRSKGQLHNELTECLGAQVEGKEKFFSA